MSVPSVFFNASVILAGIGSSSGGSAKLLKWVRQEKIKGLVSEIVLDETLRHCEKMGISKIVARKAIVVTFREIVMAPKQALTEKWVRKVLDVGDAHLFASCEETKAKYLVSLDKKHVLSLAKKVTSIKIVSPAELIECLSLPKKR